MYGKIYPYHKGVDSTLVRLSVNTAAFARISLNYRDLCIADAMPNYLTAIKAKLCAF